MAEELKIILIDESDAGDEPDPAPVARQSTDDVEGTASRPVRTEGDEEPERPPMAYTQRPEIVVSKIAAPVAAFLVAGPGSLTPIAAQGIQGTVAEEVGRPAVVPEVQRTTVTQEVARPQRVEPVGGPLDIPEIRAPLPDIISKLRNAKIETLLERLRTPESEPIAAPTPEIIAAQPMTIPAPGLTVSPTRMPEMAPIQIPTPEVRAATEVRAPGPQVSVGPPQVEGVPVPPVRIGQPAIEAPERQRVEMPAPEVVQARTTNPVMPFVADARTQTAPQMAGGIPSGVQQARETPRIAAEVVGVPEGPEDQADGSDALLRGLAALLKPTTQTVAQPIPQPIPDVVRAEPGPAVVAFPQSAASTMPPLPGPSIVAATAPPRDVSATPMPERPDYIPPVIAATSSPVPPSPTTMIAAPLSAPPAPEPRPRDDFYPMVPRAEPTAPIVVPPTFELITAPTPAGPPMIPPAAGGQVGFPEPQETGRGLPTPLPVVIMGPLPLPVIMQAGGPAGSQAPEEDETDGKKKSRLDQGVDIVADSLRGKNGGAVEAVERGMISLAGKIPVVGQAIQAVGGTAMKVQEAVVRTTEAIVERGAYLARFSGEISAVRAQAQVRSTLGDMREASELGSGIASTTDAYSRVLDEIRDILLPLKKFIIETIGSLLQGVASVLETVGPTLHGITTLIGQIAKAIVELLTLRWDKMIGTLGDLPGQIGEAVESHKNKAKQIKSPLDQLREAARRLDHTRFGINGNPAANAGIDAVNMGVFAGVS